MNNINKILTFILIFIVVVSIALASVYLYSRYGNSKNQTSGVGQASPSTSSGSTNNPVSSNKAEPFLNFSALPPAKVGTVYTATVEAGVMNATNQISATVESGMPAGLKLAPCRTEYSDPNLTNNPVRSSNAKCVIGGIPKESGKFTIRINFSVPGVVDDFFSDYPLVVNP
jgi:hypothetical protein